MASIFGRSGETDKNNTSQKNEGPHKDATMGNVNKEEMEKGKVFNNQKEGVGKNEGSNISQQRSDFDQEHDLSSLSEEEKSRMHEAYSKMGKAGDEKKAQELGHEGYQDLGHMGGITRAEQMAKGSKMSGESRDKK